MCACPARILLHTAKSQGKADARISDARTVCPGPWITHTSIYGFLGLRHASDDGICAGMTVAYISS